MNGCKIIPDTLITLSYLSMRLAFALYKYFPFGGLARDFMRIAKICVSKGYVVDVYAMEWEGELISDFNINVLTCSGWSNHARVASFQKQLSEKIQNKSYDAVIGFNKMPDLDVYYAADPCYVDRFVDKPSINKLNPRYRFYASVEKAVFGAESETICLMISDGQTKLFKKHYQTPESRLVMLPPGIDRNRRRPVDANERKRCFREQHHITQQDYILLMVGTGFKTKGVDRAIAALASLPDSLLDKTHLMVVGEDNIPSYEGMAKGKGVANKVHFLGGRSDVPEFLLSADILLHPARKENTGTVILEAMVAGLPMLVTDVCGYAKYVERSKGGSVIPSPFKQHILNEMLINMLTSTEKLKWSKNALSFADIADLYSMPEKAVEAIEQVVREKKNAI